MTVEKLNQYINSRLLRLKEEFDAALDSYTGKSIPTSQRINKAAADAEHDIYRAIWDMPDDELTIQEVNSLVLQYQKLVGGMRMDAIDILIAKNGGLV